MPVDINPTEEFQRAVKKLHDALNEYHSRKDFFTVSPKVRIHALLRASDDLNLLLPPEVILGAARFWQNTDETYYDERDYKQVAEKGALCAMYVLMDMHALISPHSLTAMNGTLASLDDDLSDLTSWCPAYDIDHDIWDF